MIIKFSYNNTDFEIIQIINNPNSLDYNIQMELSIGKSYYELHSVNDGDSMVYLNMEINNIQANTERDTFYTKWKQKILIKLRNNKLKDLGL